MGLDGTHQAVRLLGRGAAGEIWLFRDVKTRKMVAVKLFERPLEPGAVAAVLREIKVNLAHQMVAVQLCWHCVCSWWVSWVYALVASKP